MDTNTTTSTKTNTETNREKRSRSSRSLWRTTINNKVKVNVVVLSKKTTTKTVATCTNNNNSSNNTTDWFFKIHIPIIMCIYVFSIQSNFLTLIFFIFDSLLKIRDVCFILCSVINEITHHAKRKHLFEEYHSSWRL